MDYIPTTEVETQEMLRTIGASSIEDLLSEIPSEMRCNTLELPGGLSEPEVLALASSLAGRNRSLDALTSFLGFGAYHHLIPTVVEAIAARGEWLTPYTPYQAEASQGTLQMIYEFQTLVCELMQMDLANASLYDGASSLAEAAVMAVRMGRRPRVLVSETVHPHARQVVATYLGGFPCVLQDIPSVNGVTDLEALATAMKDDVACVLMQQPNVFGCLEPMAQAGELAHRSGALFVASVYPVSLGALSPPGAYGADIAVAEGRCLGSPIAYGGPGLGLFATKQAFARRVPGRLVGCTLDRSGRRGFTLTLQTREQHIRREQATSNICTNQGWLCVRATIFLSLLGPKGLTELAELNAQRGHALVERLESAGFRRAFEQPFFNECTMVPPEGLRHDTIERALAKAGLLGGVPLRPWYPALGDASVWCATELISEERLDRVTEVLQSLSR